MKKDNLYIYDNQFSHAPSSSWYNEPQKFVWVRGNYEQTNDIVTTNLEIVNHIKDKRLYGWIIEPPEITNHTYDFAIKNYTLFEKIFTYDKKLLELSDKFEILPIGGCWISEEDRKIYDKDEHKIICTITSNKKITKAHKYRHEVIQNVSGIDVYGSGYKHIENKIDVLKDYMFCIVMENQIMDYLFTEKLLDCLVTGTIPIYYGCPSIGDFFDTDGFLFFETIEELQNLIPKLNKDVYLSKIKNIENNFNLSKKYLVADDIIYEKIKKWKKK